MTGIASGCSRLESGKMISVVCFASSISFLDGDRPIDDGLGISGGEGVIVI